MFSAALIVIALASQALATVRVTAPFGSTTCNGGQRCTITWNDDGAAPSLAQFGAAHVGVFVGGTVQQIEVQPITDNVNVGTTAQIDFTVDPNLGPNGNFYFIRFISAAAKDPNFPTQPLSSFSAKFNLAGMRGTFNATVQGVVDNANNSAPPAGAPTPAPGASTPAATPPAATSRPASSPAPAASSSRPAGSTTNTATGTAGAQQTGAATPMGASVSVLGAALAAALAMGL